VQLQQHDLLEVAVVHVRHHVEQQPQDFLHQRLKRTREFISCERELTLVSIYVKDGIVFDD